MDFEIIGLVWDAQTFAEGHGIRELPRLRKLYGDGHRQAGTEDQALPGTLAMSDHSFVICIKNAGYEASLELRKLYELVSDPSAQAHGQLRVIDESGEDYLYPASFFLAVQLPHSVAEQVAQAA